MRFKREVAGLNRAEAVRRLRLWIDGNADICRPELAALTELQDEELTEFLMRETLNYLHEKYGAGAAKPGRICRPSPSAETLARMRADAAIRPRRGGGRRKKAG